MTRPFLVALAAAGCLLAAVGGARATAPASLDAIDAQLGASLAREGLFVPPPLWPGQP